MRLPLLTALLGLFSTSTLSSGTVRIETDLPYVSEDSGTAALARRLDVYLPADAEKPFPLVVWFHGGGLTGGSKDLAGDKSVARSWAERGVGIINANYRLSPAVKFPGYLTDAAQAVAWATAHAAGLGADSRALFIGGYSAGGYLATMLAVDPRYLRDAGVSPDAIAGVISLSGQMSTHFTVRAERGIAEPGIIVDDAAPMSFVRADTPPLLLIAGDNDWPARREENEFFAAALAKLAKHPAVTFRLVHDRTHNTIFGRFGEPDDPAAIAMLEFVTATAAARRAAEAPPAGHLEDTAKLLEGDSAWIAAQDLKLAQFERRSGIKVLMRLHPKSPPAEEDAQPGAYMRALSANKGVSQRGVLAVYFADEDDWRVWIGDELTSRFVGRPGTAKELTENGAIHDVKEAFLAAARARSDAAYAALRQASPGDESAAAAQRVRLQAEALLDDLIEKLGPK